jgi:rfaE bifunctional protein nucleotidyltransferase chain/domain
MNKLLTLKNLMEIARTLHGQNKRIILVGGGFDILHQGHLTFLNEAKKYGDSLIVLLESDATLRALKGPNRPINPQNARATILAALPTVDHVICLTRRLTNEEYDAVVLQVKPAIIATTKGDPGRQHKERQASMINATVVDVIERLPAYASSFLAEKITEL